MILPEIRSQCEMGSSSLKSKKKDISKTMFDIEHHQQKQQPQFSCRTLRSFLHVGQLIEVAGLLNDPPSLWWLELSELSSELSRTSMRLPWATIAVMHFYCCICGTQLLNCGFCGCHCCCCDYFYAVQQQQQQH